MDATAWTIVGATITILLAVGAGFRSLRMEIREQRKELGERIDAQGMEIREQRKELGERIDAQGKELRERIDAQGKELGGRINDLRERMAKLEGLLEAITGKHAA